MAKNPWEWEIFEKSDGGNREFKSDVISMMLEDAENALDVYNAMNGSDYKDSSVIIIAKLENGISLSVRNDASFLIYNHLNFYEHQSTYNPNAPLRFLIYLTDMLKKIIKKRDLYGRRLVKIPTPHFVVFYNGTETRPEKEVLRLSDAFDQETDCPEIELVCTIYNINSGNNESLMAKSKVLHGYMSFVNRVRENLAAQKEAGEEKNLEYAIDEAIDYCIKNHIMEDFFRENKDEVRKNMVLDYTWERREQLIREEEYEDGRQAGILEGIEEGIEKGIEKGISLGEERGRNEEKERHIRNLMNSLQIDEKKAKELLGIS